MFMVPIITTIILLALLLGFLILISVRSKLPPQQYSLNVIIGDASESESFTFLLQINSTISSATVTAMKPDLELKADIYQRTSKPPEYIESLHKSIPKLTGKSRYNYNYLEGDQPVYLTPGSSLLYDVSISNNSGSTCPARLYLFNSQITYHSFRNKPAASIDSIDKSPCLFPDNRTWSFNITWAPDITNLSEYYVGIVIDTGVSVSGNVTVERVQYNTTGLQLNIQLTSTNPSHTITTCSSGSSFLCDGINDAYLIVSVNKESIVRFQLKTFQTFDNKIKLFSLIPALIFVIAIVAIIAVIAVKIFCKRHNRQYESIEN